MNPIDLILCNAVTLCLIIGMAILVVTNKTLEKRDNHLFMWFLLIVLLLDFADTADAYFSGLPALNSLRYLSSAMGYTLRPSALAIMMIIVMRKKRFQLGIWIPVGIVGILAFSSIWTHVIFYFCEKNYFMRGPLGWLPQIVSAVYGVALLLLLFRSFHTMGLQEGLVVLYSVCSCAVGALIEIYTPVKFMLPGICTVACALYYIILCIDSNNFRNREKRKVLEDDLENGRILLAMSQIRSHFIFNLLNAVSGMCQYDPKKADDTLIRISRYLRNNIDIMQEDSLEPFTKSLEHLEDYIALEQVRFGDKIRYVSDIQFTEFQIPPLVMQPLVENAIRHGLLPKKEGGTLTIETKLVKKQIFIVIRDDGVGYDTGKPPKDGSVALQNVTFRLENMVNGLLQIESYPGKGTAARIMIPWNKQTRGE